MYGTETIWSSSTIAKCWLASALGCRARTPTLRLPRSASSRVSCLERLAPRGGELERHDRLAGRRARRRSSARGCAMLGAAQRDVVAQHEVPRRRRAPASRSPARRAATTVPGLTSRTFAPLALGRRHGRERARRASPSPTRRPCSPARRPRRSGCPRRALSASAIGRPLAPRAAPPRRARASRRCRRPAPPVTSRIGRRGLAGRADDVGLPVVERRAARSRRDGFARSTARRSAPR